LNRKNEEGKKKKKMITTKEKIVKNLGTKSTKEQREHMR
jgi:hypothetical protein